MESIKTTVFKTFFIIFFLLSLNLSSAAPRISAATLGNYPSLLLASCKRFIGWKVNAFLQKDHIHIRLCNLTGGDRSGWIIIIQDNIILRVDPFSLGNGRKMYSSFPTTGSRASYVLKVVDSATRQSFCQSLSVK